MGSKMVVYADEHIPGTILIEDLNTQTDRVIELVKEVYCECISIFGSIMPAIPN